jgi:small subunit ribosomal protein S15
MLDPKAKAKIIAKFATHQGDTGSTPVQVALLTEEVTRLTEHLKEHKKDHSSRRGLLKKIGERRRLLRYFASEDAQGYDELVKKLKLKKRDYSDQKTVLDDDINMPSPEEVEEAA